MASRRRYNRHADLVHAAAGSATMLAMAEPDAEMIASALTALSGRTHGVAAAAGNVADGAGLYAIYGDAASWLELGLGQAPTKTALYVGRADDNLATRELELHFGGRTGPSAVRRGVAALLRDHLGLRGLPRNPTRPEKFEYFTLSDEHDAALTAWMTAHLQIAVWPKPPECASLGDIEVAVLKKWSPPLNLRDSRSTSGAKNVAALKVMAADARTWAKEHGHKV